MTSPVDTSVKYFHSGMLDSPIITPSAGTLLAVLDACLVNGFGLKSVTSIVVTAGVAVVTFPSGHAFEVDTVMLVAGATPTALNGEQKVTAVTSTTASFATAEADIMATGTITAKFAPAGWVKQFSGTNLAAYKSSSIESSGCLIRVDDESGGSARVTAFTAMSSISVGVDQFPSGSQISGGLWWVKGNYSNVKWRVVATSRALFFIVRPTTSSVQDWQVFHFGDLTTNRAGNSYDCVLHGASSDSSSGFSTPDDHLFKNGSYDVGSLYMPKSFLGIGSSVQVGKNFNALGASGGYSGAISALNFPNPADGYLFMGQVSIIEFSNKSVRGYIRGLRAIPQTVPLGSFDNGYRMLNREGGVDKTYLCLGGSSSAYTYSAALLDITGPWA